MKKYLASVTSFILAVISSLFCYEIYQQHKLLAESTDAGSAHVVQLLEVNATLQRSLDLVAGEISQAQDALAKIQKQKNDHAMALQLELQQKAYSQARAEYLEKNPARSIAEKSDLTKSNSLKTSIQEQPIPAATDTTPSDVERQNAEPTDISQNRENFARKVSQISLAIEETTRQQLIDAYVLFHSDDDLFTSKAVSRNTIEKQVNATLATIGKILQHLESRIPEKDMQTVTTFFSMEEEKYMQLEKFIKTNKP